MLVRYILFICLLLPCCLLAHLCTKQSNNNGKTRIYYTCCSGYRTIVGNENNIGCEPVCDDCKNGRCIKPNVCECFKGYDHFKQLPSNPCVPVCRDGCLNGKCSAPDQCECLSGYLKTSPSKCMPDCPKGCENGLCTAPGICTCNKGYSRVTEKSCAPICKGGCENGFCSAPGKCNCNEGFSSVTDNICSPIHNSGLSNSFCTSPHCFMWQTLLVVGTIWYRY